MDGGDNKRTLWKKLGWLWNKLDRFLIALLPFVVFFYVYQHVNDDHAPYAPYAAYTIYSARVLSVTDEGVVFLESDAGKQFAIWSMKGGSDSMNLPTGQDLTFHCRLIGEASDGEIGDILILDDCEVEGQGDE